ncbi:cytochrome c-like [Muntiacus reevesi]|uniref:cytochrome c-like n=1 Tax=Muntiacus reevesi TaxID=9886 RepID=UPI003307A174
MGGAEKRRKIFVQKGVQCQIVKGRQAQISVICLAERQTGQAVGFSYTDAKKNKDFTWGEETPMEYLDDPRNYIPGTKMIFAGIKKKGEKADLIAYLKRAAAAAKSLQSCLTLCDPIDGSPPGAPVPGILQARILEWVAISFSALKSY